MCVHTYRCSLTRMDINLNRNAKTKDKMKWNYANDRVSERKKEHTSKPDFDRRIRVSVSSSSRHSPIRRCVCIIMCSFIYSCLFAVSFYPLSLSFLFNTKWQRDNYRWWWNNINNLKFCLRTVLSLTWSLDVAHHPRLPTSFPKIVATAARLLHKYNGPCVFVRIQL